MYKPPNVSGVNSAVGALTQRPRTNNNVGQGAVSAITGMSSRPAALQRRLSRMNITQNDIDQQKKKRQNTDEDQIIRDMIARRKKGLTY